MWICMRACHNKHMPRFLSLSLPMRVPTGSAICTEQCVINTLYISISMYFNSLHDHRKLQTVSEHVKGIKLEALISNQPLVLFCC